MKGENVCWPFGPGAGHLQFITPFVYNVNILWTKKGNIRKYTTFCGGINEDGESVKKGVTTASPVVEPRIHYHYFPDAPCWNCKRGRGNKKVTSICNRCYQRLDWEAGISCWWQQVSTKSRVLRQELIARRLFYFLLTLIVQFGRGWGIVLQCEFIVG